MNYFHILHIEVNYLTVTSGGNIISREMGERLSVTATIMSLHYRKARLRMRKVSE